MDSIKYMSLSLNEILENIKLCDLIIKDQEKSICDFANYILNCSNIHYEDNLNNNSSIFISGAGRSGLVAKAFAMRLMHLGFNVFIVGDCATPTIRNGDLVIIISKSGKSSSLSQILSKIKGKDNIPLLIIGGSSDSDLVKMADSKIVIESIESENILMGTAFETSSLVLLDTLIFELMNVLGLTEEDLKSRHDNLSSYI